MRRIPFTLVEVVVVIAIMLALAAVAVTTLRPAPPRFTVNEAADGFAFFCAQTRLRAMELGCDALVWFDPETRAFSAETTIPPPEHSAELAWMLPEKFELNTSGLPDLARGKKLEVFRYYPDGGASGATEFTLEYASIRRTMKISRLTGLLISQEEK